MSSKTALQEILVLEPDRLRGAVVARTLSRVFPTAHVFCESAPAEAAAVLASQRIDLFVVALRGFDLDILTLLGVWAEHGAEHTRVLIMSPHVNSTAVKAARALPITGIYDSSSGDLRELEFACRAVASGATYWCAHVAAADEASSTAEPPPARARSSRPGRWAPPRRARVRFRRR